MSVRGDQSRILTIGATTPVLETIMHDLRALGYSVQGTTNISNAATEYNAQQFDMITFGGGVAADTRQLLKSAFRQQNPSIRLLDVYAPTAVQEIIAAVEKAPNEPVVDIEAYFDRIQYAGSREPTLITLYGIIERHIDAIPFEALDVLFGKPVDISIKAIEEKLVRQKRGGYCLEQNRLFQRVLQQLGYRVKAVSARVRYGELPGSPIPPRTHANTEVTIEGHPYLVDVGFGRAVPPQPLRLDIPSPQATTHEDYRIFPFGKEYRVQVRQKGEWRTIYDVNDDPLSSADYEMMNWFTSQYPDSHFRHELILARTSPTRRYSLRAGRLTIRSKDRGIEQRQLGGGEIEQVLNEVFGINVDRAMSTYIGASVRPPS